jgi:hypothetical protein
MGWKQGRHGGCCCCLVFWMVGCCAPWKLQRGTRRGGWDSRHGVVLHVVGCWPESRASAMGDGGLTCSSLDQRVCRTMAGTEGRTGAVHRDGWRARWARQRGATEKLDAMGRRQQGRWSRDGTSLDFFLGRERGNRELGHGAAGGWVPLERGSGVGSSASEQRGPADRACRAQLGVALRSSGWSRREGAQGEEPWTALELKRRAMGGRAPAGSLHRGGEWRETQGACVG